MRIHIKHTVLLLAALVAFPCGVLTAQEVQTPDAGVPSAKGAVTDAAGEPLYQVVITDPAGKTLGTTDLYGRFELRTDAPNLCFRTAGYGNVSLPVSPDMKVTMRADESYKDDLLNYGYGVIRRRGTLSEAVSAIQGKQLEDVPNASFSQLLEGQILGLGTLEYSSDPGNAGVYKYVRGISSTQGTQPLFVVDGIVMQDYNVEYLTAAEIDNIVLLKDAAATAIYGLKGANGVVVINTKSGLPGAFDVRVTADFSLQQIARKPEKTSSYEYASLRNQAWENDGSVGSAPFSADQMARIKSGSDPLYPDNDYYNDFVRSFGTMERLGVSLSGGSQRTRVWSNINFMNQTSLLKQETDEYVAAPRRFWVNFRAKIDVDISKHVRAFAGVSGNVRNDRLAGKNTDLASRSYTNSDIYETIFRQPPTMIGPTTEDGRVTTMETLSLPTYGILNRSGYTKYTSMYASTYAGVTVDLDFVTRGLSVTGKLAFQSSNDRYNYMTQDFSRYYYDYTKGDFMQLGSNLNTNLAGGADGMFQYAISYIAQLDYKRSFGKHAAEAHLYTYYTNEQLDDVNADYPAVGFPHDDHNTGLNLSYAYDDRYVVGATFGLTASDVFSRGNRYTFVPSFSAAWVASNEAFLRDVKWLSLLKVRASYGEVALDDFEVGYYRYMYKDYIKKNGDVRLLGNPDLEPEIHKTQNYGLDLGLWDKLNLTFDYFSRRTDNMLIESGARIPAYQGIYVANYQKVNEGKMKNRGVELGISYATDLGRGWGIHAGVNYTHAKNEVIYTGEMPYPGGGSGYKGYAYSHRVDGYPLGQQFGYLVDRSNGSGYISTDEELAKYTKMYSGIGIPRKGDLIYKDVNGDGEINEKDLSPIGKGTLPTGFTTIRAGFSWKGLELDLMFQGVTGYYGSVAYLTERTASGIYNDLHKAAWTSERFAAGQEIKYPALSYNSAPTSFESSDFVIVDRSFWRLKNASLSYTLPARLMRNAGIKRLKIVLSGQNLFTTSGLDSKVIDPETGSMTALPPMRVINLGVKLDF